MATSQGPLLSSGVCSQTALVYTFALNSVRPGTSTVLLLATSSRVWMDACDIDFEIFIFRFTISHLLFIFHFYFLFQCII